MIVDVMLTIREEEKMVKRGILTEKGRLYFPVDIRKIFTPALLLEKDRLNYWDKENTEGYFSWLIEETTGATHDRYFHDYLMHKECRNYYEWVSNETGFPANKFYKSFQKTGWENMFCLARTDWTETLENKWKFLIIYHPCVHPTISNFFECKNIHAGKKVFILRKPRLIQLDKASKITIPKPDRRFAHIDYLSKDRKKYIEKKIVIIKRKFVLEI